MENKVKKYGEVFTPLLLVNSLLNTLPIHVWSNPNLKWLDPANGRGVFPYMIVKRLMDGLIEWEPDEGLRYKHIIENMIYVCELQPANMLHYESAFNPNNEYKMNTHLGSFLDDVFPDIRFDIIVGNPPYQSDKKGGQNKIYNQFCKKSLDILSDDGLLLFITPTSVLNKGKRFCLNCIQGLRYVKFISDWFPDVGVSICAWLIDKTYQDTSVEVTNKDATTYITTSEDNIYDLSDNDTAFIKLKHSLMIATSEINSRMMKQNSVDATNGRSLVGGIEFSYPVYKISGHKIIEFVQYNKPIPKLYRKNKIVFSTSKTLSEKSYVISDLDFNVNHLFTDIDGQEQADNILSFFLSRTFLQHYKKWAKSDGYGFNNAIKYCPIFDKNVKWDDKSVETFLNSFVKE